MHRNIFTFISLLQHHFLLLAKNVTVGHSCLYNWQCTGTQFASICDHYRCECQSGYMLIDNNCYPGKESVYIKFYFSKALINLGDCFMRYYNEFLTEFNSLFIKYLLSVKITLRLRHTY